MVCKNILKVQRHYAPFSKLCFETKSTKLYSKLLLVKSSENTFVLPDYVFLEIPKNFWKKSHFEPMRAGFLRKCQNLLWQISPKIMDFKA